MKEKYDIRCSSIEEEARNLSRWKPAESNFSKGT